MVREVNWCRVLISLLFISTAIMAADSSWINITSDFKGKKFNPEETMTITWEASGPLVTGVNLSISPDGVNWFVLNGEEGLVKPNHTEWGNYEWFILSPVGVDDISLISDKVRINIKDGISGIEATTDLFTIGDVGIRHVSRVPATTMSSSIELTSNCLHIKNGVAEPTQISVFDLSGKLVGAFRTDKGVISYFEFDHQLRSGSYFIRLKNDSHQNVLLQMLRF